MTNVARAPDQRRGAEPDPSPVMGDPTLATADGEDSAQERIEAAEVEAAGLVRDSAPLGAPGPPLNRRSPFMVGLLGAAGVAATYGLIQLVRAASGVLLLVGLALFLAIGLEPAVAWLQRLRLPRWAAVLTIAVVALAGVAGFLAAAIPPLTAQTTALIHQMPHYLATLHDRSTTLGRLDAHYHLQQRLQRLISAGGSSWINGALGAGIVVLDLVGQTVTVLALTVYFLADLPRIRRLIYRCVPRSRRPRVILLGDEMCAKIGGYVLGNLLTSLIAALGTFIWLQIFGVPYAVLLAVLVGLLDLLPVVGSTIGGITVSLVALTVSLPVAIATAAFYVAYRLAEDYLIVPKILGRTVQMPASGTFVAVVVGGGAFGIIGALVAIPLAAGLRIVLREVTFPRLDRS